MDESQHVLDVGAATVLECADWSGASWHGHDDGSWLLRCGR